MEVLPELEPPFRTTTGLTGYVMLRMTPEHWLSADFSKAAD